MSMKQLTDRTDEEELKLDETKCRVSKCNPDVSVIIVGLQFADVEGDMLEGLWFTPVLHVVNGDWTVLRGRGAGVNKATATVLH